MNNIPDRETASLIAELQMISDEVKDAGEEEILKSSSEEMHTIFKRLDELAALEIDEESLCAVLKNPDLEPHMDAISRFRILYNLKLEIENAKSLLESPDPWETLQNFTFYPNYLQLARTEYTGSGLKPGNCVLFLGSGPLPLSLIVLCRQYGLFGIGIEQEKERAEISREVISCLGLSKNIRIIEGNHFSLPLKIDCDLYMVAAQAEPKKEVFEHMAKIIPEETRISYRLYEKGLRRVLDGNSLFELPSGFEEYLRVQPEPPVNNTIVFLKRR